MRTSRLLATTLAALPLADARGQLSHNVTTENTQDATRHGQAVANAGDLDGDGRDDFIVGQPWFDEPALFRYSKGRVAVYPEVGGSPRYTLLGTQNGAQFGAAICGISDYDGDGCMDFAVGSPYWNSSSFTDAGKIEGFSGKTGALLWAVEGAAKDERLGSVLASLGDIDGDSRPDFICGEPDASQVKLFNRGGGLITTIFRGGDVRFGAAVSRAGDLDGDGVEEFLVGEPQYDSIVPFRIDCGRVVVYSGATWMQIGSAFVGVSGQKLGASVSHCGDIDGDGTLEYLAGAPDDDTIATDAGVAWVISGALHRGIYAVYGTAAGDRMGHAVCGMGDLDDDGYDDFVISAVHGGPLQRGRVEVRSGLDGHILWSFDGWNIPDSVCEEMGYALVAGNWNGDPYGDFLFTDPRYDANPYGTGIVEVGFAISHVGCPAWNLPYGSGLAGKNGIPQLTPQDVAQPGLTFDVQVDNSLGANTIALLLVGTQAAANPYKGGTILVNADITATLFPLDAAGMLLSEDVPYDASLYFADFFLQVLEADPFAVKKVSMTPGLQVHVGLDLF